MKPEFDKLDLHAYIDGQLNQAKEEVLIQRLQKDPVLRQELADLQLLKSLVRNAYGSVAPKGQGVLQLNSIKRTQQPYFQSMAASFIVVLALFLGWLAHGWWLSTQTTTIMPVGVAQAKGNYLLQISDKSSVIWDETIAEANRLLSLSSDVNIELLVNDEAIAMLGTDSMVAGDVRALLQTQRVKLAACRQGLDAWRNKGGMVSLLPEVDTSHTALEEVIQRIRQGWHLITV